MIKWVSGVSATSQVDSRKAKSVAPERRKTDLVDLLPVLQEDESRHRADAELLGDGGDLGDDGHQSKCGPRGSATLGSGPLSDA
jgi:hypothetical protein